MKTKEIKTAKKTEFENRSDFSLSTTSEDKQKSLQALEFAKERENYLKAKGYKYMTKKGLNYRSLVNPDNFDKKIKDGWYFTL